MPALREVVVIDCSQLSEKELMNLLERLEKETEDKPEDELVILADRPTTAALMSHTDGKQTLMVSIQGGSTSDVEAMASSLAQVAETHPDLLYEIAITEITPE